MRREPTLAFVIPCFNEEAALHMTADVLKKKMIQLENSQAVARDSFVIFVDDGSHDKTWDVITSLHEKDPSLFRCWLNACIEYECRRCCFYGC